jgi:hypothetical protein
MVAGLEEAPVTIAPAEAQTVTPVDLTSDKVDQLPEDALDALLGSLLKQGQ